MQNDPLVTFYQLFPTAPAPRRADQSLNGSMPTRAYHYCEPFRVASGYGWHLFPPIDFELLWDGSRVRWRTAAASLWAVLDTADLPGLLGLWRLQAPVIDVLQRPVYFMHAPTGEPGIVMIWSGFLARTRPGWSLLMRGPANQPQDPAYEVLEGIVETDWWFGPIASNLRLRKTDVPIRFSTHTPLFQAQPIPQEAYAEENLNAIGLVQGLSQLTPEDWEAYKRALLPRNSPGTTRPGWYRAEVQQRRRAARGAT